MIHQFDLRIDALITAYRSGSLTPRYVIQKLRESALELNPEYKLFIHVLSAQEIEPYLTALDGKSPDSLPLYGIPFSLQDNIDLAGVPTTAACPAFSYVPWQSATLVMRLIALGAVPIGKCNLDQFATALNGTCSPYGACRNSVHSEYPSGGSSSGSALAVALGVSSFSLGTDTAGSGCVPAALNNLVGLKATRGILPTTGVVPACRTLDCVTLFAATASEASKLLALAVQIDGRDEYSRTNPQWNDASAFGQPRSGFRFGVPKQLEFQGCAESPALFVQALKYMESIGGVAVPIDFSPFLQAAGLLYEGPWVAERYGAIEQLLAERPEEVLPAIRDVLKKATEYNAVETFRAQHRLQQLKTECDRIMAGLECVISPSYPRPVTLTELREQPVQRNTDLGWYTNFMNMLDYAAVAIPIGFMKNGLPWGITVFGRAFTDQSLLGIADALQYVHAKPLVGGHSLTGARIVRASRNDRMRVVVCGAHMAGLPLNRQLLVRGGRLISTTNTSQNYKLYALAGPSPWQPCLQRVENGGASIAVEVWELPSSEIGSFLTCIPAPLGLGRVELADGTWEIGFICEKIELDTAEDVTEYLGWKRYLSSVGEFAHIRQYMAKDKIVVLPINDAKDIIP